MITGTLQADVAVHAVAYPSGEFDDDVLKNGPTREHTLLPNMLGVKHMFVAVNKKDQKTVNYSQNRYNEFNSETSNILTRIGSTLTRFVCPHFRLQRRQHDGTVEEHAVAQWLTLLGVFDNVHEPVRIVEKPLRRPLQDVYKISGITTVPVGCVETGVLKPGQDDPICAVRLRV